MTKILKNKSSNFLCILVIGNMMKLFKFTILFLTNKIFSIFLLAIHPHYRSIQFKCKQWLILQDISLLCHHRHVACDFMWNCLLYFRNCWQESYSILTFQIQPKHHLSKKYLSHISGNFHTSLFRMTYGMLSDTQNTVLSAFLIRFLEWYLNVSLLSPLNMLYLR